LRRLEQDVDPKTQALAAEGKLTGDQSVPLTTPDGWVAGEYSRLSIAEAAGTAQPLTYGANARTYAPGETDRNWRTRGKANASTDTTPGRR
jgi:hypothetical protein